MITAHEARELAANSRVEVERVLETLDPLIRAEAQRGGRSIMYTGGRLFWRDDDHDKSRENSKFAEEVAYSLKTLGYSAGMGAGDHRYTVGMDEEEHFNYVFYVRW